jgi:hypothetical protein
VDDIEIKKLRNNDDNESVADSIIEKMWYSYEKLS